MASKPSALPPFVTVPLPTVSIHAKRYALSGLCDLVGLEAARADVGAQLAAVLLDPHLLQVRIEAPLGRDHRVASGLAERRPLAAAMTDLCHRVGDGTGHRSVAGLPAVRVDLTFEQGHSRDREG